MGWVWLDDKFPDHPKLLKAGPVAAWLFVRTICWANQHLTDGFVPFEAIRSMQGMGSTKVLLKVGLFDPADGGVRIHDYLEYQRSRADADRQRELASEGGKKRAASGRRIGGRFAPAGAPAGDQQTAGGDTSGSTSGVLVSSPAVAPAVVQPTPTPTPTGVRTVPTEPLARPAHEEESDPPIPDDETELERLMRLSLEVSDPVVKARLMLKIERLQQRAQDVAS